jgi:hypothetical protein
MKMLAKAVAVVSLAAMAGAAWAGGCGGGCCGGSSKEGFSCENACPLARKANEHRSYGCEGSAAQQKALADHVQKSLSKV